MLAPLGHVLERRAQRDVLRALAGEASGNLDAPTLLATNGIIHDAMLTALKEIRGR